MKFRKLHTSESPAPAAARSVPADDPTCLICYTNFMKNKQSLTDNYKYFVTADTSKFSGEWIALTDKKVVAHGKDAGKVYAQAKKLAGKKDISLAKAPDEQMLVLKLFR